jgi:hypothetical protein
MHSHDETQQYEHDDEYEAPRVRSLGSVHELTQGGYPPIGGGSPFPGDPGHFHRGSW